MLLTSRLAATWEITPRGEDLLEAMYAIAGHGSMNTGELYEQYFLHRIRPKWITLVKEHTP